jgi:hypothetical protein
MILNFVPFRLIIEGGFIVLLDKERMPISKMIQGIKFKKRLRTQIYAVPHPRRGPNH